MSTLITNQILDRNNNIMLKKGGAVVQIQQYTYTPVYENTTQNSEYDMPGVLGDGTATIIPIHSNSRILFTSVMQCGSETTWRQNYFKTFYKIGAGAWTQFNGSSASVLYTDTNGLLYSNKNEFLLTSLSTTSSVAFKITQIGHAGGGFLHLNQNNVTNSAAANNSVGVHSSITLKEISQ